MGHVPKYVHLLLLFRVRAYGASPLSSDIVLLNQVLFVRSYSSSRPLRGLTLPLTTFYIFIETYLLHVHVPILVNLDPYLGMSEDGLF